MKLIDQMKMQTNSNTGYQGYYSPFEKDNQFLFKNTATSKTSGNFAECVKKTEHISDPKFVKIIEDIHHVVDPRFELYILASNLDNTRRARIIPKNLNQLDNGQLSEHLARQRRTLIVDSLNILEGLALASHDSEVNRYLLACEHIELSTSYPNIAARLHFPQKIDQLNDFLKQLRALKTELNQ